MQEDPKSPRQPPHVERKALDFALSPSSLTEEGVFEGYASVAGNVDSDGDIVLPGAFADTLTSGMAADGVPILLLHDDRRLPVGRSVELREDNRGLYIRARIADTSDGMDARKLLKLGVLRGLSIGYVAKRFDYDQSGVRRLQAVELLEVSLVTWPANELATVTNYKCAKQGGTNSMSTEEPDCIEIVENEEQESESMKLSKEELKSMMMDTARQAVREEIKSAGVLTTGDIEIPEEAITIKEEKSSTATKNEEMQRKYASIYLPKPAAAVEQKQLPVGIGLARSIKCSYLAGGKDPERAAFVARKMYDDAGLEREFKAMTATLPAEGGLFIPETYVNEIIPLLRAKSVIAALGARTLSIDLRFGHTARKP